MGNLCISLDFFNRWVGKDTEPPGLYAAGLNIERSKNGIHSSRVGSFGSLSLLEYFILGTLYMASPWVLTIGLFNLSEPLPAWREREALEVTGTARKEVP